jgi:hypothetical protein
MKKIILIAAVVIGTAACKKETKDVSQSTIIEQNENFNIHSDGKMLIFESLEAYNKVVDNPTEELRSEFKQTISKMKYTSYAEKLLETKSNDDLIGDDYLASILNDDWIVQIGSYLYRVNKPTESVYVLSAANSNEYQDLVNENKANINIRKFSTSDNVIELAESGAEGTKALFCTEGRADNASDEHLVAGQPFMPAFSSFKIRPTYTRYGVYFDQEIELITDSYATGGTSRFYIQAENVYSRQRCGTIAGGYSFPWHRSNNSSSANYQHYQAYSGSIALESHHIKTRGRLEIDGHPQGGNPYTTYFTNWVTIRGGSSPY